MLQGRVFTASLKPAWDELEMTSFCNEMSGTATVFIINHDKDKDDSGQPVEAHTHIYIEYETPRKITTISNLLKVDSNFIEVVKSKKAILRYLTHKDDLDKYQYDDSEVFTNSLVSYSEIILGGMMSDRDIAKAIQEGRGVDLLGVVSASKLRTIQAFLQYDRSGAMFSEIKAIREKLDRYEEAFDNISMIAKSFINDLSGGLKEWTHSMQSIASEIKKVRQSRGQGGYLR